MDGFVIDRADGRADGEDWTQNYEELPGDANISIILESTTKAGVGPRLHQHPYAETFIIRRGWATFTIGSDELRGHAGQVLVVPSNTRTSSRPGRTVTRPYTSTPTPASSRTGWSRDCRLPRVQRVLQLLRRVDRIP
jgi:mannose-6-phosphate isomerase-like protein (cupin superfamily)